MITGGVLDATVKGEPGVLKMPPELVKAAKVAPGRHTGHILLAEDNELNQEIAQAILEEACSGEILNFS